MATSKTVHAQTRNPIHPRFNDPSKHYVKVQNTDDGRYKSQVHKYFEIMSPTDPTKPMYELVSEDRAEIGEANFAMLACSKEDYEIHMKNVTDAAKFAGSAPDRGFKHGSGANAGEYHIDPTTIQKVPLDIPQS